MRTRSFLLVVIFPSKLIASVFADTYYHWSAIIPTALSFLSYKLVSFLTCYPLQPLLN